LNEQQIEDILEDQSFQPLPWEQIEKVMQNGQMKQTQLLSMFGLDQFKKVVVNSEFFLFARKKTNAENRPSFQMHDNTGHQPRRSTNKIRRSMTEENDQNQNAGYQRMPTYANV